MFIKLAFLLALHKLQDGINALLLGILDEPASIDYSNLALWTLRVVHAVIAVSLELLHQKLAVHQILGAAHRNYVYLVFLHFILILSF